MIVDVTLGGTTKYLENGVPYAEGGYPMKMDTDELTLKKYQMPDTPFTNGIFATEYWLDGELVHRSLDVEIVPLSTMLARQAQFG